MKPRHLLLIISILFHCPAMLTAQEGQGKNSVVQFGITAHKARILIHNKDLQVVDNSYPNGIEAEVAWQGMGQESWNKCHCFPKLGFSLRFWDYDAPDILGYGLGGLFFIEPEYNSFGRISFGVRAGFGLTYMSNPFDAENNTDNQAYSTALNFDLVLAAKAGIRLSKQSRLNASASFNHNSNGGVKSPNRGLNYPSLSIGYSRYVRPVQFVRFGKKDWDVSDRKMRFDLGPFFSWKQVAGDVHRYSGGVELKYSRQFGRINALTFGAEYLHDTFEVYLLEQEGKTGNPNKMSLAIGHEFLLGKLLFSQQLGVYAYKPNDVGADLYQRYGLTYVIGKKIAAGVNLKVHGHVAQLVDYRIVYTLFGN
ncbi:MAG: acyloxyacyl hydrolase [Vicingaceae bacterium]